MDNDFKYAFAPYFTYVQNTYRFDFTKMPQNDKDTIISFINSLSNCNISYLHPSDRNAIQTALQALRYLIEPIEKEVVIVTKDDFEVK